MRYSGGYSNSNDSCQVPGRLQSHSRGVMLTEIGPGGTACFSSSYCFAPAAFPVAGNAPNCCSVFPLSQIGPFSDDFPVSQLKSRNGGADNENAPPVHQGRVTLRCKRWVMSASKRLCDYPARHTPHPLKNLCCRMHDLYGDKTLTANAALRKAAD